MTQWRFTGLFENGVYGFSVVAADIRRVCVSATVQYCRYYHSTSGKKVLHFYQIYANINTHDFICLNLFSQLKIDLLSSYFPSLIYSYGHFGRCIRSTAH